MTDLPSAMAPDPFARLTAAEKSNGSTDHGTAKPDAERWEPQMPAPREPELVNSLPCWKGASPAAFWVYRNADRQPLFAVVRYNLPDGGKETIPCTYGRRLWTDRQGRQRDITGATAQPTPLRAMR